MSIELKIPEVGESIQEVQIGKWLKQEGDEVAQDEIVVELETDKASMELPSPAAGILGPIIKQEGDMVSVGEVIATLEPTNGKPKSDQPTASRKSREVKSDADEAESEDEATGASSSSGKNDKKSPKAKGKHKEASDSVPVTPSARRALRQHGLSADEVAPAGKRLRAEDVERHVREHSADHATSKSPAESARKSDKQPKSVAAVRTPQKDASEELERIVPMSLIRRRIAERLVAAQHSAALLTTFNEIDMSAVMSLRREYRERFQEEYGIKLGFMPFFVKAVIDGLRHFPALNAEIRDDSHIVYRDYYHIGIAIGGGKGLVVPILRFAERMSFAEIEAAINDFAARAQNNKLEPQELAGGTFTITNGGIYGSLLSTPIVNPPQSGVLGMHAIQERPIALQGQVVIRPMMYVALTYDHRLVDGREAVSFLKRIKETLEEPARMLLEV
jgi:2-oxoglutarate dehydrogenase E2 component (dihydrolipoamide succinyltransferase)